MATFDDDVIHQPWLPGKPCAFTWKKCNTTDAFPADFTELSWSWSNGEMGRGMKFARAWTWSYQDR